ncbi:MAG: hypothetical protein ACYDBP_07750 [Leptospirales bacterium]
MATRPTDLRSLERRLSILSSRMSGGSPVRIALRPDTDRLDWRASGRVLSLGIRSLLPHRDLSGVLELLALHELGKLRASLRLEGEESALLSLPAGLVTIFEDYRSDRFQQRRLGLPEEAFGALYESLFPRRVRQKRLAINTFRQGFDPFVLGEVLLAKALGAGLLLPHERHPLLVRVGIVLSRYRLFGRYREFLGDFRESMEAVADANDRDESLSLIWEFYNKWRKVFDRSSRGGRGAEGVSVRQPDPGQGEGSGSGSGGGGAFGKSSGSKKSDSDTPPPEWDYRPPDITHGYASEGGKAGPASRKGSGLGAAQAPPPPPPMTGEIPPFSPPSHRREVFPWDTALIRSETRSLARFLKVGIEEAPLAGLTGRLIAQKLFQPTLKVMNRPAPFREGATELRILAIVDFSFSMDGWPHYYGAHLTEVIALSRVASTFDVIACSSRFQFRIAPDELNLLQPDEMEGFQNLLPMIERVGHQYDAAIVLTDCQISDKSADALAELRKRVLTIGCYVVPETVEHVRGRPIERVVEDGRQMFPATFLYATTFRGLGRKLALNLNRMRVRSRD